MVKADGVKASILASLLIQREMLGDETQEVSCVSRVYHVYLYHGITVAGFIQPASTMASLAPMSFT